MKVPLLKRKVLLGSLVPIGVVFLIWGPIRQALNVAAVQDCLDRGWEVTFQSQGRPPMLPAFIDSTMDEALYRICEKTRGYDGSQPAPTRNRDTIYRERFRALFRGRIEEIHIYYPEGFRGDLGKALLRFPALRRITVIETDANRPDEGDWKLLCARLRDLPNLEEVELGGDRLTDAAIAPLAGHPSLRIVDIPVGRVTVASVATFSALPAFRELRLGEIIHGEEVWQLNEQERQAFKTAGIRVRMTIQD